MIRAVSTALLVVLLVGCQAGEKQMQKTELFFGLSRPDGGAISEQVWQGFVDDAVTPRFPDGFTVIDGAGQWRGADGRIVHERSKVLLLLHPRDAATMRKVDEIRAAYKEQ